MLRFDRKTAKFCKAIILQFKKKIKKERKQHPPPSTTCPGPTIPAARPAQIPSLPPRQCTRWVWVPWLFPRWPGGGARDLDAGLGEGLEPQRGSKKGRGLNSAQWQARRCVAGPKLAHRQKEVSLLGQCSVRRTPGGSCHLVFSPPPDVTPNTPPLPGPPPAPTRRETSGPCPPRCLPSRDQMVKTWPGEHSLPPQSGRPYPTRESHKQPLRSVSQSSPTPSPTDCRPPGFPVHHRLSELAQTHVHQVVDGPFHPTISSSVVPFSCLQSFPASGSFPMSQFSASGGQSIGASASVLPMNIQD